MKKAARAVWTLAMGQLGLASRWRRRGWMSTPERDLPAEGVPHPNNRRYLESGTQQVIHPWEAPSQRLGEQV